MRKSHKGLIGVRKDNYPGLPEELKEFNYYYQDCGHCIMAIPECLEDRARADGDLVMYEAPFPVRYVLEKGYRIADGFVFCDAPYSSAFGLEVPAGYDEF